MSERASTKGRDDEVASASIRPEPSDVEAIARVLDPSAWKVLDHAKGAELHATMIGAAERYVQPSLSDARAAITAFQAVVWQRNPDAMPFGEEFLAENRFGDWLTVRRFDPKKPGDYSGNAVINGRTGRWWHPVRWQPLPPPAESSGRNRADATPKNPLSEGRERS